MRLTVLKLQNFRNHLNFQHNFEKSITIFYGQNAVGKTNLLEAIYFLSLPKSFRAKSDFELINWQKDFARIIGDFRKREENIIVEIFISKKEKAKKTIKINQVVKKVSDLIGQLVMVLFCPEDLNLVTNPPRFRRRYLDIILSQTDKRYYFNLLELKKILSYRNKILFRIKERKSKEDELIFWDERLALLSQNIFQQRIKLISFLNLLLPEILKEIGLLHKELKLNYISSILDIDPKNFIGNFKEELIKKRREEIRKSRTLVGPHHDDFVFEFEGKNAAFFASRGETRGIILALKLAELSFLKKAFQEEPILLLDDIFSELDLNHRQSVFNIVRRQQTIITTTELELIGEDLVREADVLKISPPYEGGVSARGGSALG